MEVVKIGRTHRGVFEEYEVMPKEEADARGITYVPWRTARGGEWALSDDGYVSKVIAVSEFHPKGKGKTRRLVVLPYARAWAAQKHLSFIQRHRSGNYHEQGRLSWEEEEARKTRTKNAVMLYAQMVLSGQPIDWDAIGKAYRPDQVTPAATVRRLFKNERIKRMIEDTLKDILKRQGITQESVIKTYARAIEIGESKGDAAAMVRANDRLAALVGLDIASGRKQLMPPPNDDDVEQEALRLLDLAEPKQVTDGQRPE